MWGRKVMLEMLNPQTGETLFYFDEHRIDFVYQGTGGGHIGDICTINLFNLSQDLIKMFADSGKDALTNTREFVRVRLSAWYHDEREQSGFDAIADEANNKIQIVDGLVMNVFGRRELPNHILALYVVPLQAKKFNAEIYNKTIAGEKTFQQVIETILQDISVGGENYTVSYDFSDSELAKINEHKFINLPLNADIATAIGKVCDAVNVTFRLEGYKLTISSFKTVEQIEKDAKETENTGKFVGKTHKLHPINLRGLPQISMAHFKCAVSLTPEMKAFDVVDITSLLKADGTSETNAIGSVHDGRSIFYSDDYEVWGIYPKYQIKTFTHSGSNYAPTWTTDIDCVVFRDSLALRMKGMVYSGDNNDSRGQLKLSND